MDDTRDNWGSLETGGIIVPTQEDERSQEEIVVGNRIGWCAVSSTRLMQCSIPGLCPRQSRVLPDLPVGL
jgi:hypothetical protein